MERRLNADRSDRAGATLPCGCGARASYAGRRVKTVTTVLGALRLERAYYHCPACNAGFHPRDRALGIEGTSLSPGAVRMTGLAAARASFAETGTLLHDLAGVNVDAKQAERTAEALGREIAADEREVVATGPGRAPTMYLGMDGTDVPVRRAELAGRAGKQADGSARTREAKLVAVCIAHEQAKAFEQTGHPPADGVQQLRELGASRPRCPMKRRAASFEIAHPVEKEHMEVNVEVRRRTEPLDQGDRTGLGAGGDGEPRLFDEASRDRTVDDARDLAQYLRPGGEQEA